MYIERYLGAIENFSSNKAITCLSTDKTFTYQQLDAVTNQLGNKFRSSGFKKGDVVMVCLFNTWHFPVAMLGTWKNLQIFSPINHRLSAGEMAQHLEDSIPRVFIYDSDLDETVLKALELSQHKPDVVISTDNSSDQHVVQFDNYIRHSSISDVDLLERLKEIDPVKDEIERLYTSGTTGLPKGVKFSSQTLLHAVFKMLYVNNYNSSDKLMNLTPWFHQGGVITVVQPGLLVGAHIFGLKNFDAVQALDLIQKHRLTFVAGAPATFNSMAEEQKKKPRKVDSLKLIHTMGSPASRNEFLLWQKMFIENLNNSYGATETASILSLRNKIHPIHEKAGSAGKPAVFTQVRVIKLDGAKRAEPEDLVKNDGLEIGQIIAKSIGILDGYHNLPGEEARKIYKGWYYMGDTATIDNDGFITIRGRTDDMFVSGGENIFPQPVEELLLKHPKVFDCVVFGLNDSKWGQICAAYIVPESEAPTIEDLERHCLEDSSLAKYKRPRYYSFVDTLEYTLTGKKRRHVMISRANREKAMFVAVSTMK